MPSIILLPSILCTYIYIYNYCSRKYQGVCCHGTAAIESRLKHYICTYVYMWVLHYKYCYTTCALHYEHYE